MEFKRSTTVERTEHHEFTVLGEPGAKGRPRFAKVGGFTKTYTDAKTASFENLVKTTFQLSCNAGEPVNGDVKAVIRAFFPIPKSWPKWKKDMALDGALPCDKNKDLDNIQKSVFDALNKIAYVDDKQIVQISASKMWSNQPRTEVVLTGVHYA